MFNLQTLLSLPVFLSTTLVAHAFAAPQGFIDVDEKGENIDYAAVLTGGEGCGDEKLQQIKEGFNEMNMLFAATANMSWDGVPEREFFGNTTRIANYTRMVEENLRRAAQYANLKGNSVRNPDIHVRCDDPNDMCDDGNKRLGKHIIYNIGNEPHLNFCGRYFKLDPLKEKVDKEAGKEQTKMELMNYYNRATAWSRQVMHFAEVGIAIVEKVDLNASANSNTTEWVVTTSTGPMNTSVLAGVMNERPDMDDDGPFNFQALKYAYGATRAKMVAFLSTQEPYDAVNNAENYALYAQARYVMERKGFYPNLPIMLGDEMAILANQELQEGERKRFSCFEQTDVVPLRQGTNRMGALLSSAPSIRSGQSQWVGIATSVLCCALTSCLGLSLLS